VGEGEGGGGENELISPATITAPSNRPGELIFCRLHVTLPSTSSAKFAGGDASEFSLPVYFPGGIHSVLVHLRAPPPLSLSLSLSPHMEPFLLGSRVVTSLKRASRPPGRTRRISPRAAPRWYHHDYLQQLQRGGGERGRDSVRARP